MSSTTTIIKVDDVSKRFVLHKHKSVKERIVNFGRAKQFNEDFWALRDINLDIALGSTVGLVGHNGSGKSTLLKVIGGIIEPTTGTVTRRGRMAALLELGAGFHPDLTGRENVYLNAAILGLKQREIDRYFEAIVDFSGIEEFIDTQVKFYSSGMYVRLAFAVAVHVDPDLLLVDEVLAVGDEPFQRKCLDKILQFRAEGRTIVVVSHSAEQVGTLCGRVVVLNSGNVVHDGDPSKGLRMLRDLYEADRTAHMTPDETDGDDPYSIEDVTVTSQPTSGGMDLEARIVVNIRAPRADWGIGFSIENTLGIKVFSMGTFDADIDLPNSVGRHEILVSLPDVRLGEGKYLVNVGLGSNNGQTFDRRPAAASFDMGPNPLGRGLIRIAPSVTYR